MSFLKSQFEVYAIPYFIFFRIRETNLILKPLYHQTRITIISEKITISSCQNMYQSTVISSCTTHLFMKNVHCKFLQLLPVRKQSLILSSNAVNATFWFTASSTDFSTELSGISSANPIHFNKFWSRCCDKTGAPKKYLNLTFTDCLNKQPGGRNQHRRANRLVLH